MAHPLPRIRPRTPRKLIRLKTKIMRLRDFHVHCVLENDNWVWSLWKTTCNISCPQEMSPNVKLRIGKRHHFKCISALAAMMHQTSSNREFYQNACYMVSYRDRLIRFMSGKRTDEIGQVNLCLDDFIQ